jgi:hypothetical protein
MLSSGQKESEVQGMFSDIPQHQKVQNVILRLWTRSESESQTHVLLSCAEETVKSSSHGGANVNFEVTGFPAKIGGPPNK